MDTLSTFDGLLKTIWDSDRPYNVIVNKNPFLNLVPKNEGFKGSGYKVPIIYGPSQGFGVSFARAQAQAAATNEGVAAWVVNSRGKFYGVIQWDTETWLASQGDAGAFMELSEVKMDNSMRVMGNILGQSLYRSGYGDIGNITTQNFVASSTQIRLASKADAANFSVGMELDVASTQTGAVKAYGSSGNGLIVIAVDRSNGILTFGHAVNDATNGIPTIAQGDYIFRRGDHSTGSTTLLRGLEAWLPSTAPTSGDNFWGVDRSVDSRLYGNSIDAASNGSSLEEVLIDADQVVSDAGGELSHFLMHTSTYAKFLKTAQGRLMQTDFTDEAGVGFRGYKLQTNNGAVVLVPDRNCPTNRIFGVEMDTWELASLGKMVQPIDQDGRIIRALPTADGFESRSVSMCQLVCKAPSHNVNIQINP